VAEKLVNTEGYLRDEIPLTESAPENIVEEVTEYLNGNRAEVAELAIESQR